MGQAPRLRRFRRAALAARKPPQPRPRHRKQAKPVELERSTLLEMDLDFAPRNGAVFRLLVKCWHAFFKYRLMDVRGLRAVPSA